MSNHAIGAVLSQKIGEIERVIAYASRTLSKSEKKYCVTRKELLALIYLWKEVHGKDRSWVLTLADELQKSGRPSDTLVRSMVNVFHDS